MPQRWTDEEFHDSVAAYVDMLLKQQSGLSFIKSHYYEELSKKYGRSKKSFEYRMRNISYVFYLMGKDIIKGLIPMPHIGKSDFKKISSIATQLLGLSPSPEVEFEYDVRQELSNRKQEYPLGKLHPQSTKSTTTIYRRDPKVKAWILKRANGICELCKQPAPFICADGMPYLEVHHIRPLAEGGPDTPSNAVAICPNCHRELHFGRQRKVQEALLYDTIPELSKT